MTEPPHRHDQGKLVPRLQSDGHGGIVITDTVSAQPATTLLALPVAAVIPTGGSISLETLLDDAFGTNFAAAYQNFSVMSGDPADYPTWTYWDPGNLSFSYWTTNGTPVAPDTWQTVSAADLASVSFVSGNEIVPDMEVQVPVAFDTQGVPTTYVDYFINTLPAEFAQPGYYDGHPSPQDVTDAASAWAAAYTDVPDTEDCYNIARDVAAAAGAPLAEAGSMTPSDNAAGGFWRIAYAAAPGSTNTTWQSLLLPGDIVRLGWEKSGTPHSFTVLSTADASGTFTVFDNIYWHNGFEAIGIHQADYETTANPEDITIFRLDPNDLYLIQGPSTDGTIIQGSTFGNLIIPFGQGDTIYAGQARNEIAATSAMLQGATLADFHVGDTIDVTDFDSGAISVDYTPMTGLLAISSGSATAEVWLPTSLAGAFVVSNDGGTVGLDGGLLGTIYPTLFTDGPSGSLIEFGTCFAMGTRIATPHGDVPVEQLAVDDEVIVVAPRQACSGSNGSAVAISMSNGT